MSGRERQRVVPARRVGPTAGPRDEAVVVEEPLAIRVAAGADSRRVAVTMRTPGDDHELAVGWLLAEGVIAGREDVADVSWCVRDESAPEQLGNVVTVTLRADQLPDLDGLDRHGLVSSACGVCGRASLEALEAAGLRPIEARVSVDDALLAELPVLLRGEQQVFAATGGIHAAARVGLDGRVVDAREDVGRHNAVDKLLGASLLDGTLPWRDEVLVLSGRASYELLQKSVVAGVPVVAAVGAPSSLAVEVADAFGITLVGFLRTDRANVYTHPHRVHSTTAEPAAGPRS